jgi:hypothetical protein
MVFTPLHNTAQLQGTSALSVWHCGAHDQNEKCHTHSEMNVYYQIRDERLFVEELMFRNTHVSSVSLSWINLKH